MGHSKPATPKNTSAKRMKAFKRGPCFGPVMLRFELREVVLALQGTDQYPEIQATVPAGTVAAFEARIRLLRVLIKKKRRPSCVWMTSMVRRIHALYERRATR